jgi:hypothetical protein
METKSDGLTAFVAPITDIDLHRSVQIVKRVTLTHGKNSQLFTLCESEVRVLIRCARSQTKLDTLMTYSEGLVN